MIQLTSKLNLIFLTIILIFLILIQIYFHENQPFLEITSPPSNNPTFHFNHDINSHNLTSPPSNKNPNFNPNFIDPYKFLHIIKNPNGSITRVKRFFSTIPPSISLDSPYNTLTKDVIFDTEKNTWVRLYLPKKTLKNFNPAQKLPVVVFAHGGGFILFSAASPIFHHFCDELASQLSAIVVSVEYRLAPENRLPNAYIDVMDALFWVKNGKDKWLNKYGNFSRCVLIGQSAGGNIVYNVMLKAVDFVNELKPLTLVGSILIEPAFGGVNITESELRFANDPMTPKVVGDLMWDLTLPVGVDRSHEYCDPTSGGGSGKLSRVIELGWWVVVVGSYGDPLIDRQVYMSDFLKGRGVVVKSLFMNGGYHGVYLMDQNKMKVLFGYMKNIFKEF